MPIEPKKSGFLLAVGILAGLFLIGWLRWPKQTEVEIVKNWQEPLLIEAVGHRRGWRFCYSGLDGIIGTEDDVRTERQLHLPKDIETRIQLRSNDTIYVFSCPELKQKEIAVPDLDFSLAFQVETVGEYELEMDPLCGFRLPKGQLMGHLVVESENDFTRWLHNQSGKNSKK